MNFIATFSCVYVMYSALLYLLPPINFLPAQVWNPHERMHALFVLACLFSIIISSSIYFPADDIISVIFVV